MEWAYGKTAAGDGNLIKRDPVTGTLTSVGVSLGDGGTIGAAYSSASDIAVFSAVRAGQGNRMVTFNLSTGVRLSSKSLAFEENNIRALAFNSSGTSYIVGTNTSPAKVIRFDSTTGAQELSVTLATGMNDVTAFLPNGVDLLAIVNSTPVKIVPVKLSTLTVSAATSLPVGTPELLDPVVVGSTAYFGSNTSPGVITALDIPTKTVIGSVTLGVGEVGARRPVVDATTGTLYATTTTDSGPRLVSYSLSGLRRAGAIELGAGPEPTTLSVRNHRLVIRYAGTRGIDTLSVAPEPNAPTEVVVTESDRALTVDWTASASVEPVLGYDVRVSDGTTVHTCSKIAPPCAIDGLTNGVDYEVSVAARSIAGVSAATIATGNPYSVPSQPLDVGVVRGNGELDVSWTAGSDGGRETLDFTATAHPSGLSCVTQTSHCVISGLPNGIPHTVRVVARNIAGNSAPSDPSVSSTPATLPGAPSISDVSPSETSVDLTWLSPSDDGGEPVSEYRIALWVGGTLVHENTSASTRLQMSGLQGGTRYRVEIWSRNAVGLSPSASLEFDTLDSVAPPVIEPPVVDPPIVDPPIVDPPIVNPDHPVIPDYPVADRAPEAPHNLSVVRSGLRRIMLEWAMVDPGTSPVVDFQILTSRFKTRGFRLVLDEVSTEMRTSVRVPKRGTLFVRVVALNETGASVASASKRVIRR